MNRKQRIHELLAVAKPHDRLSRYVDIAIMGLILLNVVALVVESVDGMYQVSPLLFSTIEAVSIVLFSIEYLARLWSCTTDLKYSHPIWGRLRFMITPYAMLDFLAIFPYYVFYFIPGVSIDLRIMRIFRAFRLLRLLKLGRYSTALQTFARVFVVKREQLMAAVLVMLMLLLVSSTLLYYAERGEQPEKFSSIPASMWWAIATLTTVGYGDMYPVTPLGKLFASMVAVLGVGMVALPTGILGAGFVEEFERRKHVAVRVQCPHCSRYIDESVDETHEAAPLPADDSVGMFTSDS